MKQFFGVLFWGLLAVGCGLIVAYGSVLAWGYVRPLVMSKDGVDISSASEIVGTKKSDGTTISGLKRTVRYTATEEEDLINAALDSLPQSPDGRMTAGAYVVRNLTRGDTPIEYNPDKLMPIASITKLVTAVVARKYMNPEDRVTITKEVMSTYGNTALFQIGETFKVDDLMYPLLMVSSNDAAEAISESYSNKKFIEEMNNFVQSIGAYRTYFADSSGLSPKNVSTANDLAIILEWIEKNDPKIIDITATKIKTVRSHTWTNPTHFLSWSYYVGGKNGYTPEANRTSASLFKVGPNDNVYAIIILDSDSRDADTVRLLSKVK